MIKVLDDHERTLAYAEVALGQIKSLRQTAIPRNYEIWYVYATGYNSPLNKIINETLARNGKLTESDLEQIYDDDRPAGHWTMDGHRWFNRWGVYNGEDFRAHGLFPVPRR